MSRKDLYVVARFLDALHGQPHGLSRSALQRAARVNYDILRDYLALLQAREFVAFVGQGRDMRIHLTDAGRRGRDELLDWLDAMFGAL